MSLLFCRFQVLAELKEYATEVDVDFVRKAVRAIGRCAIKVEVQKKKKPMTSMLKSSHIHRSTRILIYFRLVGNYVITMRQEK